jgi:hypothetical protein
MWGTRDDNHRMEELLHDMRRYWAVHHGTVYLKLKQHGGFSGHKESRDIVRAAYILARDRGMTRIDLHDLSYIYCPEEVRLADLSFLSTGRTWYESILPTMRVIDMPEIEEYRQRVRSNTWRQVGHDLLPDVDINGIDIDAPGSAMAVIAALKESRDFCRWFSRHMNKLMLRSGVPSVMSTHWQIPIKGSARTCDIPWAHSIQQETYTQTNEWESAPQLRIP